MKLGKNLIGILIAGMSMASVTQLSATTNMYQESKQITVANKATAISGKSDAEIEAFYNQKALEMLKKYLSNIANKLPNNAKFAVYINDKEHLDQEEKKILESVETEYKQKRMTEEQYKKAKQQLNQDYEGRRKQASECGYTKVSCIYDADSTASKNGKLNRYEIDFNAETSEVVLIMTPMSDKGWAIQVDKSTPNISADTDKKITTTVVSYIKKHSIAGIKSSKIVYRSETRNMIFVQDTADANKLAIIELDPATYEVTGFETGKQVKKLLEGYTK